MYGEFMKSEDAKNMETIGEEPQPSDGPQSQIPPQPSTAKKRIGLGAKRIEPLRTSAMPELSDLLEEVSRNARRSHGPLHNRYDHHTREETNRTIPETLNSSKEWNLPDRMEGKLATSHNDIRAIPRIRVFESTPMKSSHSNSNNIEAPMSMDKENFYTPRKSPDVYPGNTPAQSRCPLSALPVDAAPPRDTLDGVGPLPETLSNHSVEQENISERNVIGSSKKRSIYDSEGFRTPQCKVSAANQPTSQSNGRQRLFAISSSYMVSNVPLHPAVVAGQQQAKQLQQQREAQRKNPTTTTNESGAARKLWDGTHFKTTASAVSQQAPAHPTSSVLESKTLKQEENLPSSNNWLPQPKPMDCTPYKAVPTSSSLIPKTGETTPFKAMSYSSSSKQFTLPPASTPVQEKHSSPPSFVASDRSHQISNSACGGPPASSSKQFSAQPAPATVQEQLSPPLSATSESTWLPHHIAAKSRPSQEKHPGNGADPVISSSSRPQPTRFSFSNGVSLPHQDEKPPPQMPTKFASELSKENRCLPSTPMSKQSEPVRSINCPPVSGAPKPVEPARIVAPTQPNQVNEPVRSAVSSSTPAVPMAVESGRLVAPESCQPKQSSHCEPNRPTSSVGTGHGEIKVNGHSYVLLSCLGRGGSSKVFQVLDRENNQLKAVKCVNLAETDPSICEGYLNEIKLLADLQGGDCVIRMFDHEHLKESSTLFVVMEKGDTDFSKLIKDVTKSKKISPAMIVYYWIEMLNCVNFIHKHGTIHSDLKPANFLLVSGRLKLIDFGIASAVQEDMTSVVKDSLTGTYNYISPEALASSSSDGQTFKISYKSDVWSLGCILYNLVYGRTPFQHITNQFQKLNAIVNPSHKIPFPDPPMEGCPSALIQAMKMCLIRNPKERASVDELLQLHYLEQVGPERKILSEVASLAASVGLIQQSEDNRYAAVVRAIQRLIMDNERQLPFLGGGR